MEDNKQPLKLTLKQLNEMNDKAKKLCDLMKKGIVDFVFKKKSTGEMRKAKGTLKIDLIPPEAQRKRGRPKKRPEELVVYYDVEKKGIRSFLDYLLQKVDSKSLVDPKAKKKLMPKDKKDVNSPEEKSKQTSKDKKLLTNKEKHSKEQDRENGKED